jgi:hypothetical protein
VADASHSLWASKSTISLDGWSKQIAIVDNLRNEIFLDYFLHHHAYKLGSRHSPFCSGGLQVFDVQAITTFLIAIVLISP